MAGSLSSFSMMDLFRSEVETHASALSAGLLALERDAADASVIEAMMRAAHSIKGAARIVNLEPVVQVSHVMEDVFVAVQHGQRKLAPDDVDVILRGADFLSRFAQLAEAEVPAVLQASADLVTELVASLQGVLAGRPQGLGALAAAPATHAAPVPPPLQAAPSPSAPRPAPAAAPAAMSLGAFSMLDLFRTEVQHHAAALGEALLGLERDPTDASALEAMMRAAHSIKGAARIVSLEPVVQVSHVMEDVFVAAQSHQLWLGGSEVDVLLRGLDFLTRFGELPDSELPAYSASQELPASELAAALRALLVPAPAAPSAQPAPPVQLPAMIVAPPAWAQPASAPRSAASSPATPSPPPRPTEMSLGAFSMLDLFRAEVESHSAVLSDGLLALERAPGDTRGIEALMRAAHSIKGAARVVQLDPVVRLSHVMEDCFVAAQQGTRVLGTADVDLLLRDVDLLARLGQLQEAQIPGFLEEQALVIEELIVATSGVLSGKPAARPAAAAVPPPAAAAATPPQAPAAPRPATPSGPSAQHLEMSLGAFSMLDLFRAEVESHSAVLADGLLALERAPAEPSRLEAMMRAAHSIKGAARVVQLDPVVRLSHVMEDCFVAAQQGKLTLTTGQVDVLLRDVDLLSRLGQVAEAQIPAFLGEQAALIEELVEASAGVLSGRPAVATAPALAAPPRAAQAVPAAAAGAVTPVAPSPAAPAPTATRGPERPPTGAGASPAGQKADASREVRITSEKMNRLMGLAGETLVGARWLEPFGEALQRLKHRQLEILEVVEQTELLATDLGTDEGLGAQLRDLHALTTEALKLTADRIGDFDTFARRSSNLSSRLYREVMATRMRPFADGVKGFPRLVRDISRQLGKKVRLDIVGQQTEVDRDILEKLDAPLNHLIRNGLDHGIDPPEQRLAIGKPEEGAITLRAEHRAGMLMITVSDDGRGVSFDYLKNKIVDKGLATLDMVNRMSEPELLDFLFLPGFSTAKQVTEISGRGVGLDVVQNMVREVGGNLRASSIFGQGMTFTLQLPLTRSVMRALLVEISGEPFALSLSRIDRALLVPREQIEALENKQYFRFSESNIGLISAHQILGLDHPGSATEELAVVVLSDQRNRYGLVVDRFVGEQDIVVRPLDGRLGKVPDVAAAGFAQDGELVLVLDIDDMVSSIDNLLSGGQLRKVTAGQRSEDKKRKRVLVVDDSITVREMERSLLENHGYEVDLAVDGVDGWNALRTSQYDLVVSDIDMPRMTGIELVTTIRREARYRELPIMIVSYKDREEDRMRGLRAGANYYLTKSSFQDDTMINAVMDLIGKAEG